MRMVLILAAGLWSAGCFAQESKSIPVSGSVLAAPAPPAPVDSPPEPPLAVSPSRPPDALRANDLPPRAIKLVRPEYPPRMVEHGITGLCRVKITVGPNGIPLNAVVEPSSGYAHFDAVCMSAALRSRFHPATRDGKAMTGTVVLPYRFVLEESGPQGMGAGDAKK